MSKALSSTRSIKKTLKRLPPKLTKAEYARVVARIDELRTEYVTTACITRLRNEHLASAGVQPIASPQLQLGNELVRPELIVKPTAGEVAAVAAGKSGVSLDEVMKALPKGVSTREALEELSQADPVLWVMLYRRLKRKPLTFDMSKYLRGGRTEVELLLRHRPWLVEPLRDQHRWKVYEKARQIGVSELSISEVVHYLAVHKDKKWLYTFPRDKQLETFAATRITPMFAETPRIAALLGKPNQTTQKKIGDNSFLLLRSAWESNLGEGVDCDGVTFDEKDRMKDGIEVAFRESMKSSPHSLLREVSTPTVAGRGVDKSYKQSDMRVWHVRCTRCGLWQPIDAEENIVQMKDFPLGTTELPADAYAFACRKLSCRGPLDRIGAEHPGRYIATYPDRTMVRGYSISQLMCAWITATGVMQDRINYKFEQLWENYVLGRVSKTESVFVQLEHFDDCTANYPIQTARSAFFPKITVGIDWGGTNWFVVLGKNAGNGRTYLLNIGIIQEDKKDSLNMDEVCAFIDPYQPDCIVADAGYGRDRNSKLLRRYDPDGVGRFFACSYNPNAKGSRTFKPVWSDGKVLVDRTIALKLMCRAIREREVGFYTGDQKVELLKKHVCSLGPLREEEDGEIFETVVSLNGAPDHLAHALGYALLAMDAANNESKFDFSFV